MKKQILGVEVKDRITGFVGIVTAIATYITGCDQYLVQPQGDGTKYPDPCWIDESRLEATERGQVISMLVDDNIKGSDIPAPIK